LQQVFIALPLLIPNRLLQQSFSLEAQSLLLFCYIPITIINQALHLVQAQVVESEKQAGTVSIPNQKGVVMRRQNAHDLLGGSIPKVDVDEHR